MTRYDPEAEKLIAQFKLVLGAVRDIRARNNIPHKKGIEFSVKCDDTTAKGLMALRVKFRLMANPALIEAGPHVEQTGLIAVVNIPPTRVVGGSNSRFHGVR